MTGLSSLHFSTLAIIPDSIDFSPKFHALIFFTPDNRTAITFINTHNQPLNLAASETNVLLSQNFLNHRLNFPSLHIKPEVHDVAVLYDVFLAFNSYLSGLAAGRFGA